MSETSWADEDDGSNSSSSSSSLIPHSLSLSSSSSSEQQHHDPNPYSWHVAVSVAAAVGGLCALALLVLLVVRVRHARARARVRSDLVDAFRAQRGGAEVCRVCYARSAAVTCAGCPERFLCLRCSAVRHHRSSGAFAALLARVVRADDTHVISAIAQQLHPQADGSAPSSSSSSSSAAAASDDPRTPLLVNAVSAIAPQPVVDTGSSSYTSFSTLIDRTGSPP